MIKDMKFDEASLTGYLVDNLKPLTQDDPVILAKYVVALLNKDKPSKELQKLCADNLVEFLGNGAKSFTVKLFQALDDGSIVKINSTLDCFQKSEPSEAPPTGGIHPLKNSSLEEVNRSSTSEPSSDPEDKEVSDDDDRNHKHRRREARPNYLETDVQEQSCRSNRKRNNPCDNGKRLLDTDIQLSDIKKEYNPASERNASSKFDKRHSDLARLLQAPFDLGPLTRFSQPFRSDLGARFDLSTSIGCPGGRGRARSMVPWNQHDSRFNPQDALDFASQMASQGPGHPNLFVGTRLPSVGHTQCSSWGGFGFIPGMSNGIMDPLNPLGLQGALGPSISPPLNFGIPRQRCRDFEERGFCLRGDMCLMEHGLNRIVVEDVQSLSQFNLPVSVSNSHASGIQTGSGSLPPASAASGQLANAKITSSKISKSGAEDALKLNDIPSTSGGVDADVYDPDQPLWNNDRSHVSASPLRLPSPNIEDDRSWDGVLSARQSFRSDGIESEIPSCVIGNNAQITGSSVWGRFGSASKSNGGSRTSNMTGIGTHGNEMKENRGETIDDIHAINQRKGADTMDTGSKVATIQPFDRSHIGSTHKGGRASTKALQTLYVNCIPQKSNRRDALFSHFQKFGEVINIHIPLNSEKAFVQFSKREEAEAALKSPDAVMGNRFIKLSWANRDRILDNGQSSGHNTSVQFPFAKTSAPSKQPIANGGKETPPISAQRSNILVTETPISIAAPVNGLTSNAPKPTPPVKKKRVESKELLEELRRKQESLAKKRDDIKRQLDKFEKHTISNKKGDVISEQAAKRHKVDTVSEANKAAVPKDLIQVTEKILDKSNKEKVHITNVSKTNSAILQQSLKNMNPTSSLQASLSNRFKLDNRSTSFRVLPPLPIAFASVDVIKDHFSHYGVISSVVLEEPEHTENEGLSPCTNCSACITFSTRHFAERAYQSGKCWEGHHLQLNWITFSPNANREPTISPKLAQKPDIQLNLVTSGSSSASVEKSPCSVSEVAAIRSVEPNRDFKGTDCLPISQRESAIDNSPFSRTMSECGKSSFESSNA